MPKDITIVIVNYNVQYFLEQCLNSIFHVSDFDGELEVIVVDNDSSDDSISMVEAQFPQVILIENKENVGFSIANNQGLRIAKGSYLLLLNPDTLISEDTLRACYSKMEEDKKIGALGVRMVDGSGNFLPESKRGFPSPMASFYRFSGIYKFFPKSEYINSYYQGHIDEYNVASTEILCGAFMFIRKKVLSDIGLLDEDFFMYGEDIDLSYRIRKAGHQILYFPLTSIVHFKGESTKKDSVQYTARFYNAMDIFAKKHFKDSKASIFLRYLSVVIWLKASVNYLARMAKKLFFPLLDLLMIFGGLTLIAVAWAKIYFKNEDYYANAPLIYNFIIYSTIWFISILFGGGYDKKINFRKLLRNIFFGTLVILAIYGLLEATYRSSRAIILLAAVYAMIIVPLFRLLFGKFFNLEFDLLSAGKKIVILANDKEAEKIKEVLIASKRSFNSISKMPVTISTYELKEIVQIQRIDEIICNVKDVGMNRVIVLMSALGSLVSFKITGDESLGIVGSKSKNKEGEIYTLEINYELQTQQQQRNKRTFDILTTLFTTILFPISLTTGTGRQIISNLMKLLTSKITIVGYQADDRLPSMKKSLVQVPEAEASSYAKSYTVWKDLRYLWKSII